MKETTDFEITRTLVKKFVADDGKVFPSAESCREYEDSIKFKKYLKKYNVKHAYSIDGITDSSYASYTLKYTGDKKEFLDCIRILRDYFIEDDEISWTLDLSNVRIDNLSLDKLEEKEFKEGAIYIFAYTWEENCDDYDFYYWSLWDANDAFVKISKTIKEIEEVFQIKYTEVSNDL